MVLKAKNISKSYAKPSITKVLDDICLEVNQGESLAICGKSGEGKSTLLHILGLLESPCCGSVEICGKDAKTRAELRNQHIGFIFQSFYLLEDYTVLDNVLMPAYIAKNRDKHTEERAQMLLEKVGLQDRTLSPVKFLSGGEKQRVAIARALCNNPDLILADEPTGNLDQANSSAIHELLLTLAQEEKKALIIVTHDTELAALCERRLLLKQGTLCAF